jgi:hypothetical protein
VSGTGQAQGTAYSDAFYVYTDSSGNPITPVHFPYPSYQYGWTLWINGVTPEYDNTFISAVPAYRSDHTYTFSIVAPGGHINFAVGDAGTSDNTGSYTVTITGGVQVQASVVPSSFFPAGGEPAAISGTVIGAATLPSLAGFSESATVYTSGGTGR